MRTESDMMTEETPEFGLADGLFVFVGVFGNIKGMR